LSNGGSFLAKRFSWGDFFGWYLAAWNEDIEEATGRLVQRLAEYDLGALELAPENARDLLKKLYHYLLPREIHWYVRIREQRHLDYPLMGAVKVELPYQAGEAVPSSLIDEISAALVAERQATPHGRDSRWHAHLYPVYLAEQAVKNGFVTRDVLKAGLKWPVAAGGPASL